VGCQGNRERSAGFYAKWEELQPPTALVGKKNIEGWKKRRSGSPGRGRQDRKIASLADNNFSNAALFSWSENAAQTARVYGQVLAGQVAGGNTRKGIMTKRALITGITGRRKLSWRHTSWI